MVSKVLISSFASFLVAGGIFFSIAWFAKPISDAEELMNHYRQETFDDEDLQRDFDAVSNQSLHDMLANLTSVPHLAGDFQDIILANWMKNKFLEFGLDQAEVLF